jgi:two-component system, cell cycle sensor histidine kinase and response regulator CckA
VTVARILIVEDEAVVALDLRTRLTRLGYFVIDCVGVGESALEVAERERPDLTLMDIRLRGEMDGIEAAEQIRSRLHLPVVFLTAHADDATVDRARVTEPFGYILKPFEERELRTMIEMALYKHAAERRLRESERRFATTLASIGDGVIATDILGRVTFMNPVSEELTGWRQSDALGKPLQTVFTICNETTRKTVSNPIERVLAEGVVVGLANHTILIGRSGEEYPIDDCAAPIVDDDGTMTGAVLVFRDVSKARLVEVQMRNAQKMEAIGQLAGGIAHDFNNMLTIILNYSEILLESTGNEQPWSSYVSEIRRAGIRSSELTSQLMTFCRKQLKEPKPVDLNNTIQNTEQMLMRLVGANVKLTIDLTPGLGSARMDQGQLERILVNLAVNARDAITDQGNFKISTSNVELSHADFPTLKSGIYRCVAFSDDGHGISPAHLNRIFEPFFTTKEPGKGTGLGLSAVFGIVSQCDGHITCESELGKGTTFRLYLPAASDAPVTEPSSPKTPLMAGHETILLVEDEEAVRSLSRQILTTCGYKVLEAENGLNAIDVAKRHSSEIALVVTDVIMPGMGARPMLQELKQHLPGIKVLFISGYGDETLPQDLVGFSKPAFLQKPFSVSELTAAVRRILDDLPT